MSVAKKRGPQANRSLAVVRANLAAYSREPFLDILAKFVQCAPTMEAIKAFAEKSPDKWASALRTLGQLYGYADKIDVTNNVFVEIHNMSDAELMQRLSSMRPVLELTANPMQEAAKIRPEEEKEKPPEDFSPGGS